MRRSLNRVMLVVSLTMLAVGLLLLAYGYYAVWYIRHEAQVVRATLSFVYLIPGWALTTMGYLGWRIEEVGATRQGERSRESA